MDMLRNLLQKLNRVWYDKSRITPTLTLRKGTGTHRMVTVKSGIVFFHSLPYTDQMTQTQEVYLDDLKVSELVDTISTMGYEVTVSEVAVNEGIMNESAVILLEVENRDLNVGETLYGFTSNLWRVMYPVHRSLVEAGGDVDLAVEQIMLPSARGYWLDYWVGFFKMKRLPDEADEMLLRRAFMSITSVKANDMAIEELVSYYINASVGVLDYQPSIFEVRVSPEFMDTAQKVHELVGTLKGAGVDYILNYATGVLQESYPNAFRSAKGQTFRVINETYRAVQVKLPKYEDDYSQIPPERSLRGFRLNQSRLNSSQMLSVTDKRIIETLRMVMRDANGVIVQEM